MEEWSRVRRIWVLCDTENQIGDKKGQEERNHANVFQMHWLLLHSLSGLWFCPNSPLVSVWGWEVSGFSWLCPEASQLPLSTSFIWNPLSLSRCHPATSPLLALTATIYLQIFCTFTEGLDIQLNILIIMQMLIWTLQLMGAHHVADQYRNDYMWNMYYMLGSQKPMMWQLSLSLLPRSWNGSFAPLGWQLCPISGFHIRSISSTWIPDSTPLPWSHFCPHPGTCIYIQLLHYPPIRSLFTCSLINVFAINTR